MGLNDKLILQVWQQQQKTNFAEIHERCGSPEENLIRFNSTKCGNKPYKKGEMYQEICKLRPTTVLKVIRLKDIFDLMKIKQIRSIKGKERR